MDVDASSSVDAILVIDVAENLFASRLVALVSLTLDVLVVFLSLLDVN